MGSCRAQIPLHRKPAFRVGTVILYLLSYWRIKIQELEYKDMFAMIWLYWNQVFCNILSQYIRDYYVDIDCHQNFGTWCCTDHPPSILCYLYHAFSYIQYINQKKKCSNFFIITNLIHKFLVHLHKLHEIKFLYMFRAHSAHQQEVNDANCINIKVVMLYYNKGWY